MASKNDLVKVIDELLNSKTSKHSKQDKNKLEHLKKSIQQAKTFEDGVKFLLEFAKYFGMIFNYFKDS